MAAERYLKEVERREIPSTRDLIQTFLQSGKESVEIKWQELGKDRNKLYMSLRQYVKANELQVEVHKEGEQLILSKKKPKEVET